MDGRAQYLLGLSDFTQTEPNISDISLSTPSPNINETITVSATVTDGTDVFLGFRNSAITAPFSRVQMYDDGAHGDGAANDGVYGVDLTISYTTTEYYIYAENENIGMFSPRRAEYEYYSINAVFMSNSDVAINEFMASNDTTVKDQDDEYEDWIELYNNGTASFDLSGYFLTDDANNLTQWSFPQGTVIEPDGYLTVWADKDEAQEGLHANFKLSTSGESVILVNPADTSIVDVIDYAEQTTDISYGRFPNGIGAFQTMNPTFNQENTVTTGIEDVLVNNDVLKVYPNPAKNNFFLEYTNDDSKEKLVTIFNITGTITYQNTVVGKTLIDTSDWSPGMYIIKSEGSAMKLLVH